MMLLHRTLKDYIDLNWNRWLLGIYLPFGSANIWFWQINIGPIRISISHKKRYKAKLTDMHINYETKLDVNAR